MQLKTYNVQHKDAIPAQKFLFCIIEMIQNILFAALEQKTRNYFHSVWLYEYRDLGIVVAGSCDVCTGTNFSIFIT